MYRSNWYDINNELNKIYLDIFKNINIENLDNYEKRKIIFDYLCNNIKYDFELLDKIKKFQQNPELYRVSRNPSLEVESVLKNKKGICNAIAQVYKMLLEKVGIYSLCIICDDGTDVKHQLNLVYDEQNDSFSFDDVTSVIVNRGSFDNFFDYDLEDAKSLNQGCRPVYNDTIWLVFPTNYVYSIMGRTEKLDKKYAKFEASNQIELPENILSHKKRAKKL